MVLKSSDGERFEIDAEIAESSATLRMMMEVLGPVESSEEEVVQLDEIYSEVLAKSIDWMTNYQKLESNIAADNKNAQDTFAKPEIRRFRKRKSSFLKGTNLSTEVKLIEAAEFLEIPTLRDCMMGRIADRINRAENEKDMANWMMVNLVGQKKKNKSG